MLTFVLLYFILFYFILIEHAINENLYSTLGEPNDSITGYSTLNQHSSMNKNVYNTLGKSEEDSYANPKSSYQYVTPGSRADGPQVSENALVGYF